MHAGLVAAGHRLSRKRVWRLMKAAGLQGRHPKAWKRTTVQGDQPVPAPDLIGRGFIAETPNQKWCGDSTYVKTWQGWAYVATVIDLHSRGLVGWAIDDHMRTDLVTDALDMAIKNRRPGAGVIFHFRPRRTVYVWRVQPLLQAEQRETFSGQDRRLLRQCRVRIILRYVQEGTDPHPAVAGHSPLAQGVHRLNRELLQHDSASFNAGILDARRI